MPGKKKTKKKQHTATPTKQFSDYAAGIFDCSSTKTFRRQFSRKEGETLGIAEKEALALQLCLLNIPDPGKKKRVRIHVDNLSVVHAHHNLGGRNLLVHEIIKWI